MTQTIAMRPRQRRYTNALSKLLADPSTGSINRELFKQFFEHQEYKLKRLNGLQELDEPCYITLYCYIVRFRNVLRWFDYRPLTEITQADIKRVYDDLEDGKIRNPKGKPYASRSDYYHKVFKGQLFKLAGKDQLARNVIEFSKPHRKAVRFIREQDFRRLARRVRTPRNQLLMWLAWDYGENINAHLQLRAKDFHRQIDPETGEPEYRINYRPEILKRSRRPRSELSNYPETVDLLDEVLPTILPGEPIFTFGYRYAKKIMDGAAKRSGVVCEPTGDRVTWKDLRSGMACDLLSKGWTRDEVNARLGHAPSSDEIDKYINFLAIDQRRPKRKVGEYLAQQREKGRQLIRHDAHETISETTMMPDQLALLKQQLMAEIRAEMLAKNESQAA
ncbi:MAG: hypothetical protein ACE37H_12010 [Phycisphaeraceae bacterium]